MSGGLDESRLKAMVTETWKRGGMDTLVKVVGRGFVFKPNEPVGYCTTFKYVVGRTSWDMELILGIGLNTKLLNGADIYVVDPLPPFDRFELRGYSHLPGGHPVDKDHALNELYPPGDGAPQWKVLELPQSCLKLLGSVAACEPFVYPVAKLPPPPKEVV